jgi:hypothetical protein
MDPWARFSRRTAVRNLSERALFGRRFPRPFYLAYLPLLLSKDVQLGDTAYCCSDGASLEIHSNGCSGTYFGTPLFLLATRAPRAGGVLHTGDNFSRRYYSTYISILGCFSTHLKELPNLYTFVSSFHFNMTPNFEH